ncbi:hypothetical protein [Shewanella sp. SR44-3]|uniref:hypothetical protein n=1 Tax=unclassified Shewanella TaxID=196818 RepID=UPI0015FDB7F0|nr:hypothetical protein [Shewanella sp. SR44-3]MBB1268556.1 hypothetical protein [Shewanella sp. SR44-3]
MNLRSKLLAVAILGGIVIYGPSFEVQSDLSIFSDDSELIMSEKRLSLSASELSTLKAETGAGKLEIQGVEGLAEIELVANVYAYDDTEIELSLNKNSDRAELIAKVVTEYNFDQSPYIDLMVRMPAAMVLDIKDGSGSIKIDAMMADIKIHDGSGSIAIDGGKDLAITDGSGSISIKANQGNIALVDGSGSINLENVGGDLAIEDGSGSININKAAGNVAIKDGSGGINIEHVQGLVVINDGSGSINVKHAKGLTVKNAGSGSVNYSDIDGPVNL